jgi:hypothetical protein
VNDAVAQLDQRIEVLPRSLTLLHRFRRTGGSDEHKFPLPPYSSVTIKHLVRNFELTCRERLQELGELVDAVDVVGSERSSVAFGDGRRITFFREACPVTVNLRAVGFDESRAFAVGDGGTMLERGPRGSWHLDESGTREDLRAIDRVFASERVLVVGDHGTILVRKRANDTWHREPSPANRDLFAVRDGFIVGAQGTMLADIDGRWRNVPTGAEEDLRTLWECSFNEHRGGATIFHKAICAALPARKGA